MDKTHSGILKTITGVVLISQDGTDILCCLEDMQETKEFTIGQIFTAVRVLYGKDINEYGTLWPKFRVYPDGPISNDWIALKQIHENCESDYEFLVAACEQLKEEVPAIVERKQVQEKIELFKAVMADLANNPELANQ